MIKTRAVQAPEATFAVFGDGERWSNSGLAERVWRRANALRALDVQPGDYVSSWLPPGKAGLEAWFAINAAGGLYAPLNTAYKGSILEHVLNLAGSRVLIAHAELIPFLVGCSLPHLKTVIVVGSGAPTVAGLTMISWDDVASADLRCPSSVDDLEVWDDMALIYTSGTTGPSKGVRCSYLHHYTYAENNFPPEIGADDRFFLCNPLFHAGGTSIVYGALQRGASLAVTSHYRTETFWDDVRRLGVTTGYIFAAMANFLRKQPESPTDRDNSMRIALVGPMIADSNAFAARFGVDLYTVFGMTEIPVVFRTELNPLDHRTCGRLVDPDHFEARIVDEFDQEVPDGVSGELIVRHSRPWSLNSGYLNEPEATAAAWRNGWFHTGDAFYRDQDGNYFFVDRIKDSIRRRGENISSMEVEQQVISHPAIADCACIAVPSEHDEDEIMAFVVPAQDAHIDFPDVIDHLRPRLPHFMIPRYFEVCTQIPRSPSLKIQKHKLRGREVSYSTWDRDMNGITVKRATIKEEV
jgi:crotonobetaine/carnitine-CoA ligase